MIGLQMIDKHLELLCSLTLIVASNFMLALCFVRVRVCMCVTLCYRVRWAVGAGRLFNEVVSREFC